MKKDYTHIAVVLDRSGSMSAMRDETISGFNVFLNGQKEAAGQATLTLTQFDTEFLLVHSFAPINEVPELNYETFVPRGCTALYDAIGLTINSCGKQLAEMVEDERPEKVVIVILTDGEENSSSRFSYEEIQRMIAHQTSVYSWQFVFLGANINAVEIAQDLGIRPGNAMKFKANRKGTQDVYDSMSEKMIFLRSLSVDEINKDHYEFFDDADREKQVKAGLDNDANHSHGRKGKKNKSDNSEVW